MRTVELLLKNHQDTAAQQSVRSFEVNQFHCFLFSCSDCRFSYCFAYGIHAKSGKMMSSSKQTNYFEIGINLDVDAECLIHNSAE